MSLYFISLGLGDENDISIKGLNAIKQCDLLYLDIYTSILSISKQQLEKFYEKEIIEADRDVLEQEMDSILDSIKAKNQTAGFLVVGDVFAATTHSDLYLRAIERKMKVELIFNASIITAVACCGLQCYRFGETVSIPFFTEKWRPYSFYDKIKGNRERQLHTLCLLDIKVKERTEENLIKNKKIYEPPRFMSCKQAAEQVTKKIILQLNLQNIKHILIYSQLLESEEVNQKGCFSKDSICVGVARIGQKDQAVVVSTLEQFAKELDLGKPLHSFVICADELHDVEREMLELFVQKMDKDRLKKPQKKK